MAEDVGIDFLKKVKIEQKEKSKGFRTRIGKLLTVAAGPDVKSYVDISWPYDIDLMSGDYAIDSAAHRKNRAWVEIMPNLDLHLLVSGAAIGADVTSGQNEVSLNAQAQAALNAYLSSDAVGMMTQEVYFRLTSIPGNPTDFTDLRKATWNTTTGKLMSPDGSAFGLTATSGDKVYITTRWEDGSYIAPGEYIRIGDEAIGASVLPAGTVVRFIVENAGTSQFECPFNLVYMHS